MIYNSIKTINTFNEYVDFIKSYKEEHPEEIWYRGHRDNSWLLGALLYRNKKMNIHDRAGSLKYDHDSVSSLRYDLDCDFLNELELFKRAIDGKVPKDFNDFHYTFLGQHYGLKTPAMDWTTDPLVALFFALDNYIYDIDVKPIVFMLSPGKLNRYSQIQVNDKFVEEPLNIDSLDSTCTYLHDWYSDQNAEPFAGIPFAVRSEREISRRISRQSGVFTLMSPIQPLNYPWIQTTVNGEPFGASVEINPDSVAEIKSVLQALDISTKSLYGHDPHDFETACENAVKDSAIDVSSKHK